LNRPRYYYKKKRYQRKKSKFKQGFFTQISEKYVQPSNKYMNSEEFPQFRSSWELQFMRWCEKSDIVKKWSTEYLSIPYVNPVDKKIHRYFPDFFIQTDKGKFIIEIKPNKDKKNPVNLAKWEAAQKWAEDHGYKFVVLTEKELKKWGII
jgi:hypothetical protein